MMGQERELTQRLTRRQTLGLGLAMASLGPVLALGGCAGSGPAFNAEKPSDVALVVELTSGLRFAPDAATIRVGETVEWRNVSFFTHTVTFDASLARKPEHVLLPPGAEPFDSGRLRRGEVFRHTFAVPGEYRYFCIPHERVNMLAGLTVTA